MRRLGECAGMSLEHTGSVEAPTEASVGDGFPDQLGNVENEIGLGLVGIYRRAYLAFTYADSVIEAPVLLGVTEMKDCADDLPPPQGVRPTVPVPLEHDRRSVIGLDDSTEVRPKRPRRAVPAREVRTPEATADRTLTTALRKEQVLFPPVFETDHPALGIRETDPIERLEPQPSSCGGILLL